MAWWDAIQPEAMTCQSMRKTDSTGYVRFLWESIGKATEFSYASIFDVKIGQKPERAFADLREKTVDTLLSDLGTVALVIEGSDLSMTEDNSVPTARCIQDTKKRELVTGSNLQRLRCCVCHFHHEQALRALYRVRHFFEKVLKKVRHYRVDVVAGDATAAAYRYQQRQVYQYLCNFWVAVMLRAMQREVNMNRPFQSRLHCDYSTNNHHSQLRSTDYPDCCFMAILSWRILLGPIIVRKLWSNTCERTQSEQKEQVEDSSYPKGIEIFLRETARKSYPDPENPDNPMLAPRDYGNRT